MVQDLHPEPGAPAGHRPADPAVADHPERGAVDVLAEVLVDGPAVPSTAAQVALALAEETGCRQDQREGQVGGGVVEHARRVADGHAGGRGRLQVDVVVADGDVGDDTQLGSAGDHRPVDAVGEHTDDGIGVRRRPDELAVGERLVVGPLQDVVAGLGQGIETAGGQSAGDQDSAGGGTRHGVTVTPVAGLGPGAYHTAARGTVEPLLGGLWSTWGNADIACRRPTQP